MRPRPSENTDKLSYREFARSILEGESLEDKFLGAAVEWDTWVPYEMPPAPGRKGRLAFSDEQIKFPKAPRLVEAENKAIALHSFANHELLAIEMMATALLVYPHETEEDVRFKKGILVALREEQTHLNLYLGRLRELGYDFGDFPLNAFFWRQMEKLTTPAAYAAVMALTFEAANLDFAQYYARVFRDGGDLATAGILETVLADELGHVAFGAHWMKKWKQDKELWDYYRSVLPWPLTPARGRGIGFDPELHRKAVGDDAFVARLVVYEDSFNVTRRPNR
jgi:uncharacterized ferritin-like protein (DUF455 family)